ncbi:peptidase inhibitor family I36 protein [Kribbella sandramycini]|nr:peptidase inhibitor family I36 protein [Kribbella sandramycini]
MGIGALILAGGAVAGVLPASASWGECSSGYLCLWGNRNYSGGPWFEKNANGSYNTGWSNNDETSSVANRSGSSSMYLYNDTNQSSEHGVVCLPRGYSAPDLNETNPEFDDRISSLRIFSGACASSVTAIGSPRSS